MSLYHINAKGEPGLCRATKACPFGSSENHYANRGEARTAYEKQMVKQEIPLVQSRVESVEIGQVSLSPAGGLQVYSESGWGDPTYYPLGNLTTELSIAKSLHQADLLKEYQTDSCRLLAQELWAYHPDVEGLYYFASSDELDYGSHQLVKLRDGSFVDSLGVWSREGIEAHWRQIDPSLQLLPCDQEYTEENSSSPQTISNPALYQAVCSVIESHFR